MLRARFFTHEKDAGRLGRTQPFQRIEDEIILDGRWVLEFALLEPVLFTTGNNRMPLRTEAGTLIPTPPGLQRTRLGSSPEILAWLPSDLCQALQSFLAVCSRIVSHAFTSVFWKGETPPSLNWDSLKKGDNIKTPNNSSLCPFLLPAQSHL